MVIVDDKMQVPAESRRIQVQPIENNGNVNQLGEKLQAAGGGVKTRWAYPPYDGMVYYQDAQFITDCSWYRAGGVTKACFETVFTEEDAGSCSAVTGQTIMNPVC